MDTFTPSRLGPFDDSDFQTPIPGLFADLEAGSGSVALTDDFREAPAFERVPVLQHWLRELSIEREAAIVQLFRTFAHGQTDSIVALIDGFRRQCERDGIACPTDLAVLLQRY